MARKNETLINLLTQVPWWVSVVFAAIFYVVLKFIVPAIEFQSFAIKGIINTAPQIAHLVAFVILIPAPVAAFNAWRKRKLLHSQKDLNSVRSLSWREFEELVAEAYRRQGYTVIENPGSGPDGGIDLVLKKDGNLVLIQCKQWRANKVGVNIIREMYGVMIAKHASGVMVITSGLFTQEAKNFAAGKPIDLIEGNQLVTLIGNIQKRPTCVPKPTATATPKSTASNICPKCGAEMILRTAQKGPNVGQKFWGCSNFPKCRATVAYKG